MRTKIRSSVTLLTAFLVILMSLSVTGIGISVFADDLSEKTYNGATVKNVSASPTCGDATIRGTGTEVAFDAEKNSNVLVLPGGSKGAGNLTLPADLHKNTTDSFTVALDVKVVDNSDSYTRIFTTSPCNMGACDFPWNSSEISLDIGENNKWRSWVNVGKNGGDNAPAEEWNRYDLTNAVSRGVWHHVSMSVTSEGYKISINGEVAAELKADLSKLFGENGYLQSYVNTAIGDTIYQDKSLAASVDNVAYYNAAFENDSPAALYDFEEVEMKDKEKTTGSDNVYTDGTELTFVSEIGEIASPSGNITVKIHTDESTGRYFYSAYNNGNAVIYASKLGINTEAGDLSKGLTLAVESISIQKITDDYQLLNGKHTDISDTCTETAFDLRDGDGSTVTVVIRVYDDGIAFRYEVDNMEGGTAKISSEASEFVLPDDSYIVSYTPNVTYEGTFEKSTMDNVYAVSATYTTPTLACIGENECWMLLTEAAVFSEKEPYCSSVMKTVAGSKNLTWTFGNKQNDKVTMEYPFATPWRVAVIAEDLNTLVNTDIITSVNPDAEEMDWSWVKPGKVAWSWWSYTSVIEYDLQYDYIDFAAENGWDHVCLDAGWLLWDDYQAKVKALVDYAEEKNIGIWLWYGVNDTGNASLGMYPKYSLLDRETIEREFSWAESIGVKGVKVDYYESDSQQAMKQMYLCADIAADHKLMVLFHGCTNPGGENRTYPNILSYEAVYGAEYYNWRAEPTSKNIVTYVFTRNVVGSADFTPTAMPVNNINASYGFMLGTVVALESGVVHYAENVNVYEGYNGLSFMNDVPVVWDETVLAEGDVQKYATVARRSGEDWYIGSLSVEARTTDISLDFLEKGKTYTAYIYKDNEARNGLEIVTQTVTSEDVLAVNLTAEGGFAAKITTGSFKTVTDYEENYTYFEAEDAKRKGSAAIERNQFASGMETVAWLGAGEKNTVSFDVNVEQNGIYEVKVFYLSGADRSFDVTVNGDKVIRTEKLNSAAWSIVDQVSLYLKLTAGNNTISFGNISEHSPNLDRIAVSQNVCDHEETVSYEDGDDENENEASKYTYVMYEAEDAVVTGASLEGKFVGWLGSKSKKDSNVLFDQITVDEDGTYYLLIRTIACEKRDVYVSVNGEDGVLVTCKSSGSWDAYSIDNYITIELKSGTNTIMIYNESGPCPNLDGIGISTTVVSEEEETTDEITDTPEELPEDTESPDDGDAPQTGHYVMLLCILCVLAVCLICVRIKRKA